MLTKNDWPVIENSTKSYNSVSESRALAKCVWNVASERKSKTSTAIVFPAIRHSTSKRGKSAPQNANTIGIKLTQKRSKNYPLMVQFYKDRKERIKALIRSYLPNDSKVSQKQLCRFLAKIKRKFLFEPLSIVLPKILVENESGNLF